MNKTSLLSVLCLTICFAARAADSSMVCVDSAKKVSCITNLVSFIKTGANQKNRAGQFTQLDGFLNGPGKKADINDLFEESFPGADPNSSTIDCFSSPLLSHAVLDGSEKKPTFDFSKELIVWLLRNGADPMRKDSQGLAVAQLVKQLKLRTKSPDFQTYYDEVLGLLRTEEENQTRQELVDGEKHFSMKETSKGRKRVRRTTHL